MSEREKEAMQGEEDKRQPYDTANEKAVRERDPTQGEEGKRKRRVWKRRDVERTVLSPRS